MIFGILFYLVSKFGSDLNSQNKNIIVRLQDRNLTSKVTIIDKEILENEIKNRIKISNQKFIPKNLPITVSELFIHGKKFTYEELYYVLTKYGYKISDGIVSDDKVDPYINILKRKNYDKYMMTLESSR